jgi:Na+-transporting methylmalonyl-CoA/oxaloacetate decarboxylase gamma subunit
MSGLQETFYIMGIVFMALTFLILLAIVTGVFVIRAKVNKIHDNIEHKIHTISSVAEKSGELSSLAGSVVAKQAKKAIKKRLTR